MIRFSAKTLNSFSGLRFEPLMVLNFIDDVERKDEQSKRLSFYKEYFYEKRMCFVLLVGCSTIVELVYKERVFPAWCCTKQTKLEGSNFLRWASIAPTESCVTYLPSDCPS